VSRAQAQTYSIDWYTIDGGGGTSTGGVYAVSGTIGQPDAGGPMTGGNYSLTGGFWSLIAAVQTGAPRRSSSAIPATRRHGLLAGCFRLELATEQQSNVIWRAGQRAAAGQPPMAPTI